MEFSQFFEWPYIIYSLMIFTGFLIFAIQAFISFIGVGIETDGDGLSDLGSSDFSVRFISLMTVASFAMVGGTFGLYANIKSESLIVGILVTLIAGSGMAYLVYKIKSTLYKLQSNGIVKISNAVGKTAKIYITIKPGQVGQIEVGVQGRRKYLDAVAKDGSAEYVTGTLVKVVDVKDGCILVVEKAD